VQRRTAEAEEMPPAPGTTPSLTCYLQIAAPTVKEPLNNPVHVQQGVIQKRLNGRWCLLLGVESWRRLAIHVREKRKRGMQHVPDNNAKQESRELA
jgi:hypothetical protein